MLGYSERDQDENVFKPKCFSYEVFLTSIKI